MATEPYVADPFRIAEWNALPDTCGISGCDNDEADQRGPVFMRDDSMHKVCTEHWEPVFRVLGEQASWESTDAMQSVPRDRYDSGEVSPADGEGRGDTSPGELEATT